MSINEKTKIENESLTKRIFGKTSIQLIVLEYAKNMFQMLEMLLLRGDNIFVKALFK